VGVVLTVLELRNLVKQRRADMAWRIYQKLGSKEFLKVLPAVWNTEFNDYDDFTRKYGDLSSEKNPVRTQIAMVLTFYEGTGFFLSKALLDLEYVDTLFPVVPWWEKLKPLVEEMRKEGNHPEYYHWFEYLYNEVKKREQKLQVGVKSG
jgi:hypothetical protein